MTVPVPCPGAPVDGPASAPRKRRRRAPASGASDDCFACSKSNIKCDRRRPYCSQCLEFGSECSGYKTQLTWGVGVASRGKLRGLSLPVARSAPAVQSTSPKPTRASTTTSVPTSGSGNGDAPEAGKARVKLEGQSSLPTMPYTTYDFINMIPNATMGTQVPPVAADWSMDMPQEHLRMSNPGTPEHGHQQLLRRSLQRLHPPLLATGDEMNLSSSAGSIHSYSDTEYSPVEHSFPDDISYFSSPMPTYNSYSSQNSPVGHSFAMIADQRGPTSCPDQYYEQSEISSSLGSSHQAVYDMNDTQPGLGSPAFGERPNILYDDDMSGALSTSHDAEHFLRTSHAGETSWHPRTEEDYSSLPSATDHSLILPSPEMFHIPLAPDLSPRLSFWLNYYDKIICPITVAIDSPSNPYRRQILGLSLESPSLQHAICALASCNLRMKRRQTHGRQEWSPPFELEMHERVNGGLQLISNVRNTPAQEFQPEGPADESAMQEEYQNRSHAVQLLNQQLSDPENARHDSVLATLLILCHYRMCESGIAQFKTQFAGVKKLLGMRASGRGTGNWGWMETLFTFFDAITATVNDREAQLRGGYLDMIANPSSPGSGLENLAGFDGRLFKIIATLGRLNLLSQRRPVLDPLRSRSSSFGRPIPTSRPHLSGQALVDYYKFHATKFDGNGFARTSDSEFVPEQFLAYSATSSPVMESSDESRSTFWAEWTTTRSLLQAWEFSPSSLVAALPIPCDQALTRGFAYVSEAFRYAALLYIERLACPHLPSGHLNFQNLVSQVLFFVEALGQGQSRTMDAGREDSRMEKFLLWPLFVAGSECVSELHRDIVRARCRGLVGRSGYGNNFAGLGVLEKIWKENGIEGAEGQRRGRPGMGQSPFRWTEFMDGMDGEYIMV